MLAATMESNLPDSFPPPITVAPFGPLADGLGYAIEGGETAQKISTSHIVWDSKAVRLTADEAMQEDLDQPGAKLRNAEKFLEEFLANGPQSANECLKAANEEKISERTLRRARKSLEIKAKKLGKSDGWEWSLP